MKEIADGLLCCLRIQVQEAACCSSVLHPPDWGDFAVPTSSVSTESLGLVSSVESVPTGTCTTSAAQEERWIERRKLGMHSGLPSGGD